MSKAKPYTYTKPNKNGLYKEIHNTNTLEQWKEKVNVNYRPGVNTKYIFIEVSPGRWHAEANPGNVVGKYYMDDPKSRFIEYINIGGPG